MLAKSNISWTDYTINVNTGCNKVGDGCKHCYAEPMTKRLQPHIPKYANGFNFAQHANVINEIYHVPPGCYAFINSMSDLFHDGNDLQFIQQVYSAMNYNRDAIFQILTKRPQNLLKYDSYLNHTDNIWVGVSVEHDGYFDRIDKLRNSSAALKIVSFSPLLGPVSHANLTDIGWVILSGESGHGFRPLRCDWVRDVRDKCVKLDIPFYFSQWGGRSPRQFGHTLDGVNWRQFPFIGNTNR